MNNLTKLVVQTRLIASLLTILLLGTATDLNARRLSRELNVDLLINQVGYFPVTAMWPCGKR